MSLDEERHYLDILGDQLSLALGKAVWSFARIEWLTYEYMKELSSDDLDMLMGDQFFKARTKLIKKLVLRIEGSQAEKDQAISCIARAETLADQRNTIVHNPWQIWIDFNRRDFMTEIQKYTDREKKFDLTKVQDFTENAQKLASDLKDALSALTSASRRTR